MHNTCICSSRYEIILAIKSQELKFYLFILFIQSLMRVAQLFINNYSTLWPSKIQNKHVQNQLRNHLDLNDHVPY